MVWWVIVTDSTKSALINKVKIKRGFGLVAECDLPKVETRVRFSLPALRLATPRQSRLAGLRSLSAGTTQVISFYGSG